MTSDLESQHLVPNFLPFDKRTRNVTFQSGVTDLPGPLYPPEKECVRLPGAPSEIAS